MANELDGTVSLKEIIEITTEGGDPLNLDQFKNQISNVLGLVAQINRSGGSLDRVNLQRDGATLTSDFSKRFEFECYVLTLKPEGLKSRARIYYLQIVDEDQKMGSKHLLVGIAHTNVDLPKELMWKDIINSLASFT
ncbi:MAG: hypothetical protein UT00_C0015G0007 [Parcubacteria group bacterium GW2011_GWA1_38_7]|nr:MAG: hypothetical protein UT00_C0015G0007 [Parcubacteria group bacterium GW2011_GWA1_38_7]